jgi:hypothetical protein
MKTLQGETMPGRKLLLPRVCVPRRLRVVARELEGGQFAWMRALLAGPLPRGGADGAVKAGQSRSKLVDSAEHATSCPVRSAVLGKRGQQ